MDMFAMDTGGTIPMSSDRWQFQSEAALEDLVWSQLNSLFGFQPLARQYSIDHQVCDILSVTPARQLAILELKNVEDRYVVQQLTRYYDAVLTEKPFANQIDYFLPTRLVALAPQFHSHNLIDQQYHRLSLELWTFRVLQDQGEFYFEWRSQTSDLAHRSPILSHFHHYLIEKQTLMSEAPVTLQNTCPPKSLQKLMEGLPELDQRNTLLAVRDRILTFDQRMAEVGRTTTTSYGLRKGKDELFKGKLCAEFVSRRLSYVPRLMLYLPYPKREFGGSGRTYLPEKVKGFTWAEARYQSEWDVSSALEIYFFLGKSRNRYSFTCNMAQYQDIYNRLTGLNRRIHSMDDLLDLALEEWRQQVDLSSS
jgi:Endonuclease NucS